MAEDMMRWWNRLRMMNDLKTMAQDITMRSTRVERNVKLIVISAHKVKKM
jgi:hypothetical protein